MGLMDKVKDVGNKIAHQAEAVKDASVEVAKDAGKKVVNAAESAVEWQTKAVVKQIEFQAGMTRYAVEKSFEAAQTGKRLVVASYERSSYPGVEYPPAAQGLEFAETKGASELAYKAKKDEIYQMNGKRWKVVEVQDSMTGFRAIALKSLDPNDKRVIVAYAGTKDLADWGANIPQAAGLPTLQYSQAVVFAQKWKNQSGNNVILTGHSLGGGLASYASLMTGLRATAVNSAPLAINHTGFSSRITQYFVFGEALTAVDMANQLDLRPGNHIAVKGRKSLFNPKAVIDNHSLENVAPAVASPTLVTE